MKSAFPSIPNPANDAPLRAAIKEQKLVVARLVSVGKNAGEANAALYELTDALFQMRSTEVI
jgi:hypothetical protein